MVDATERAAHAWPNGNAKKGDRLSGGDGDGSTAAVPQPIPATQRSSPSKQKGKGRADANPALLEAVASVLRQQQLADGAERARDAPPAPACFPAHATGRLLLALIPSPRYRHADADAHLFTHIIAVRPLKLIQGGDPTRGRGEDLAVFSRRSVRRQPRLSIGPRVDYAQARQTSARRRAGAASTSA